MDAKAKDEAEQIVMRIHNMNFDERDILSLLILIREHCDLTSPLREIAHFIAHRRRDRGDFHKHIISEIERINKSWKIDTTTPGLQFVKQALEKSPVYSKTEIQTTIIDILNKQGLGNLSMNAVDGAVFCIVSLLQDCKFVDKAGKEVGHLLLIFDHSKIALFAQVEASTNDQVIFPLISIDNKYLPFNQIDDKHAATLPNNFIKVSFSNGKVIVNSR